MATQTVEFGAPAGQTVTARLFAAGSDTVIATATATARTNATGIYTAAFTNLTPGLYRLIGTNAAGTLLCQWWTLTESATATYPVYEVPPSVVVDGVWNALLSSYTVNGSFGARIMRTDSASAGNGAKVTGAGHVAADIHELQPQVITAADFAAGAIDANALAADAVAEIRTGLGLASANLDTQLSGIQSGTNDIQSTLTTLTGYVDTEVAAIKSVTDKLNTGLVADGAVFQFTANMLELAPQASGGGSATIENQELILDELNTLRSSFASAVGRLAVASQITGFPAALVRNSDYSTVTESEIRLSLNDLDGNPITEIGGVQCSEIDWLFGLGSERAPAIIEGAATWDNANNQLVIQIDADDTAATPLGTLSWQIGCTIDTTTRYLGGGTTRLIERHF